MDPDGPLPPFIVEDDLLTSSINAEPYAEAKMNALRSYPTQISVDGPFFALSNNRGNEIWGTEFFRIAKGTAVPRADGGLEDDLFAGLE